MQVYIRKARIIDPQSEFHNKTVDILVEEGIIKNIATTIITKAETVIEAKGLCVSPGWVDVMADYCEPGFEQKETIESGLFCAVTGGFTDIFLAPGTNPPLTNNSMIEFVKQRASGNTVNLHPLGSVTQNLDGKNLAEMLDMYRHGAVGFTDGWKPVQNIGLMLKALEYVKAFKGVIIQLPLDSVLSSGGLMNEGVMSTSLGMQGIPEIAETLLIQRDIELAKYAGSRLHVTGVSTAASLQLIKKAKEEGVSVTCSVTPYHMALTDTELTTYNSVYKVSPPLRTEIDRVALINGLKNGIIDCIATHHRPHEWDAKAREFEFAGEGMALQETAFNVVWNAVKETVSIERLVEAMAVAPRDIFGLKPQVIKKGAIASLTLFSTELDHTLVAKDVRSMSRNNPFIGKKLSGKVIGIVNNGQLFFSK